MYTKIANLSCSIQSIYMKSFVFINDKLNKYIFQIDYIEELKSSNEENLKYKLLYEKRDSEFLELNKLLKVKFNYGEDFKKTRSIAYAKFDDHSKVLLDYQDNKDQQKIKALITFDGFSAGIVLNKQERTIALLNQNKKCNYTVYIGKNKAPGITAGINEDGLLIIKYVPIWVEIEKTDEIITSGMDSIFPYGIKVGKVIQINTFENTKEILAEPYANTFGNRDYFIYEKKENNSSRVIEPEN